MCHVHVCQCGCPVSRVCVLIQFNYEDHDKENKITIIIEAATRLLPVHMDVKQLGVITFENMIYSSCLWEFDEVSWDILGNPLDTSCRQQLSLDFLFFQASYLHILDILSNYQLFLTHPHKALHLLLFHLIFHKIVCTLSLD